MGDREVRGARRRDEGRGVNETRAPREAPLARATMHCAMHAPPGKAAILPEVRASAAYDPDCRRCARLAAFLDAVRAEHPDYFCRPGAPVRRARRVARHRRARARHARRERDRPAVHRRLRGHPALRNAARLRLRVARDRRFARRRSRARPTAASPTRSSACRRRTSRRRREVRACNALPRGRSRSAAGGRRDPRARPHRARCGAARARPRGRGFPVRATAPAIRWSTARCCSTAIIAAATTPTRGGSRRRCSARCSTAIAAHLGGSGRAGAPRRA